jgi:hypothetical protein
MGQKNINLSQGNLKILKAQPATNVDIALTTQVGVINQHCSSSISGPFWDWTL